MSDLRNQEVPVLSIALICELLENGYTRFQDERTFKKESIEKFLLDNFSQFNENNVKDQIGLMFEHPDLKGKRTQKVVRQQFTWGMTTEIAVVENIVPEPTEEIPVEYSVEEFDLDLTEETEVEKLAPWELIG
jgi:hypothetical protein